MHGDQKHTLSFACEQQIEAEANYAAGRLLFLQEAFVDRLQASALNFEHVKELGKIFGNTMTSTLWRTVECSQSPVFGLVSQHPRRPVEEKPLRYFVRSRRFWNEFRGVTATDLFQTLQGLCTRSKGPIGQDEILLVDTNGDRHVFFVEVFFNGYEALTLGVYRRVHAAIVT